MIKSVLIAHPIAEVCFLSEALYWLAIGRFPTAVSSQYADDGRNDDEWTEGIAPNFLVDTVTKDECKFAGLPVNPAWEAEQEFYDHIQPVELERWLSNERDEGRKESRRQQLAAAVKFENDISNWKESFKSCLDLHRARLFVALREGKVLATGKKLPTDLLLRLINDEDRRQSRKELFQFESREEANYAELPRWEKLVRESIPREFWNSTGINWEFSCVSNHADGFGLILIDTMELLAAFPIPESRNVRRVSQVGDSFVLLDDEGNTQDAPASRVGRPPYRWEEFYIEIARQIQNGTLPEKQEAMISAMQAWCLEKWGRHVGRSTLLQKIKPFYDALVRTSEK
jgi:hypothetical protein